MELKEYQSVAVNKLIKILKGELGKGSGQQVYFEAPTGAGKTVMASSLLEQLTESLPFDPNCLVQKVAFMWIAPNTLHLMALKSMKTFFRYSRSMHPLAWDDVDMSERALKHGDVLFLNWASIDKDKNKILRGNEQNPGLIEVVRNTQISKRIPIVAIIDEEHLNCGDHTTKARQILDEINPDIELRMSATPRYTFAKPGFEKVYVKRQDVVDEEIIKKDVVINLDINANVQKNLGLSPNQYLLKVALAKREELKHMYELNGSPVNPLLLIQLPNDSATENKDDKRIKDEVLAYLKTPQVNITEENGRLAIWLSEKKTENLPTISKNNDSTDVMLFKEAIAKGWDCPRAAVLLIFREIKSQSFTVQTVGRIMRMPELQHYSNDVLNHGYVYTNLDNGYIEITQDQIEYVSKDIAYLREEGFTLSLETEFAERKRVRNRLGYDFKRVLKQSFIDEWKLNAPTFNFVDIVENEEVAKEDNEVESNVLSNRKAVGRLNIRLDVKNLFTIVPKDVTIDASQTGRYETMQTAKLAQTQGEIDRAFNIFCAQNVGGFAVADSTPVLASALLKFMNDYLEYIESEAKKIILHTKNCPKFVRVIKKAIDKYADMKLKEQQRAQLTTYPNKWTLPKERWYNGNTHNVVTAPGHVLQPFYELKQAYDTEKRFRDFLETHYEDILWWYKNGDSGKDNFSVVYTNNDGKFANFYVDFIIMLRNGRLCLFDTKSPNGGIGDSVKKHNALIDYIDKLNKANGTNIIGGIIIEDNGQWLYSPMHINDAADHGGWSVFDPEKLNAGAYIGISETEQPVVDDEIIEIEYHDGFHAFGFHEKTKMVFHPDTKVLDINSNRTFSDSEKSKIIQYLSNPHNVDRMLNYNNVSVDQGMILDAQPNSLTIRKGAQENTIMIGWGYATIPFDLPRF